MDEKIIRLDAEFAFGLDKLLHEEILNGNVKNQKIGKAAEIMTPLKSREELNQVVCELTAPAVSVSPLLILYKWFNVEMKNQKVPSNKSGYFLVSFT